MISIKKTFMKAMLLCSLMSTVIPTTVYANTSPVVTEVKEKVTEVTTDTLPVIEETETVSETQKKTVKKEKPVADVEIVKTKITIKKGKSSKLSFKVKNTKKSNIVWTSSNTRVAKVSSSGKVTVKGGGTAIITARVKGTNIKDTIKVIGKNYYTIRVRTTGYCNCRKCAGKWAGCRTAMGTKPKANRTIAVDRRKIKLGTKVKIGKITYRAEDTGSGIKGNRIDIYYSTHSRALRHGVKYQTAKVYY